MHHIDSYLLNHKDSQQSMSFLYGHGETVCLTYRDLYLRSVRLLHYLQEHRLMKGSRLIFQLEDPCAFVQAFWACVLGGVVPVPIPVAKSSLDFSRLFNIWRQTGRPLILTDKAAQRFIHTASATAGKAAWREEMEAVWMTLPEELPDKTGELNTPDDEDIAYIQFSSGSTGDPKGVLLSHKNVCTNVEAVKKAGRIGGTDLALSWLPLTFNIGLIGFHLIPVELGIDHTILSPELFIRDPLIWMDQANQRRTTILSSPNFGLEYFLRRFLTADRRFDWDLSCVRLIFNGGEPISRSACTKFLQALKPYGLQEVAMRDVYGMSEATLGVSFAPCDEAPIFAAVDRRQLSVGQHVREAESPNDEGTSLFCDLGYALDGCAIKVCDADYRPLADGTVGYVYVKGDSVSNGYLDRALDGVFRPDGWLYTGDIGFLHRNRLVLTGRAKDMLIVRGHNYYCNDLERLVLETVGVKCAIVILQDQDSKNDELAVFVQVPEPYEKYASAFQRVEHLFLQNIGQRPKSVLPVERLPVTGSGKVDKETLKSHYLRGAFQTLEANVALMREQTPSTLTEGFNDTEKQLAEICAQILQTTDIDKDTSLFDLGGNSTQLVEIQREIEYAFPGLSRLTDLFTYPTISKMAAFLDRQHADPIGRVHAPRLTRTAPSAPTAPRMFSVDWTEQECAGHQQYCSLHRLSLEAFRVGLFVCMLPLETDCETAGLNVMRPDKRIRPVHIKLYESRDVLDALQSIAAQLSEEDGACALPEDAALRRFPSDDLSLLFLPDGAAPTPPEELLDTFDVVAVSGPSSIRFFCNASKVDCDAFNALTDGYRDAICQLQPDGFMRVSHEY